MTNLATPDLLPGVFPLREHAEAAVKDLQKAGFTKENIGIALIEHGHYRLLDEEAHDVLKKGLSVGATLGTPAGGLAGITVMAFVLPGVGTITAGGLVLAATKGFLWGAFVGGWTGLMAKMR